MSSPRAQSELPQQRGHFWPLELRISVHTPTEEAPALRVVFRTNAGKEILGGHTTAERRATMYSDQPHAKARRREGKALDPSGRTIVVIVF
jgi:hypothetical protein